MADSGTGGFQWLKNGNEAFPAMLEAIAQAHQEVRLETYRFSDDALGGKVLAALLAARARDVKVRLLVDAAGSIDLKEEVFHPLQAAGADVRWFNRLSLSRFSVRDHRKIRRQQVDLVELLGGHSQIMIGNDFHKIDSGWTKSKTATRMSSFTPPRSQAIS